MPGVLSIFQKVRSIGLYFYPNKVLKTNERLIQQLSHFQLRRQSDLALLDEEYQYFEKSSIPTTHFQDSLPTLPIPSLEESSQRYLRAQRPLLDPVSYNDTVRFMEEFVKNEGARSQKLLVEETKMNKSTSYISKPWFDMYLLDRRPLPVNVNPFLVFKKCHVPQPNDMFIYTSPLVVAANLLISSLRFYKSLKEEYLQPEIYYSKPSKRRVLMLNKTASFVPRPISWYWAYLFEAYPLDMSQYPSLFNTTRIPVLGKDHIKHVDGKKHLLVMRKGHFYVVDVMDGDGNILAPGVILGGLHEIISSTEPEAEYPVGILTTQDRDKWAAARQDLHALGNTEVLELIDSSLFNLVLDDERAEDDPVKLIRLFLHGNGTNRWFDKSFSLIVTGDGYAGINFEHSWGDGVAVLRYFNDIYLDSENNSTICSETTIKKASIVRKIEFNLDDDLKGLIDEAKKEYKQRCNSLEVRALDYPKFGRDLCKQWTISPDAVMQLAFQMAYDKLKGKQVATYESCSTAAFKHGRTETVRPCTVETQEFCKAIRNFEPASSMEQLRTMVKKCSQVHFELIKQAAMGKGFDRHLFALKLKCEDMGLKPAALFSDPAYKAINHNILSTSTLASDALLLGAFGPVVPYGYGIGYSLWKERLGTIVTNYTGKSDGEGFVQALQESFDQLHLILKS